MKFVEQLKLSLNSIKYTDEKEMVNMSNRGCCNRGCNRCCRRERCGCGNNCGGGFGGNNCGGGNYGAGCGGGSIIWLLLLFGGCF